MIYDPIAHAESLDRDLDRMWSARRAYWQRLEARARRLHPLGGVEPASVHQTLDQLVAAQRASLDAELARMQRARHAHFQRLDARARRLATLTDGREPDGVYKTLEQLCCETAETERWYEVE